MMIKCTSVEHSYIGRTLRLRLQFEPFRDKTNKMTVRPANSDQPGHPPSLIRVFAMRFMGSLGPKLPLYVQRRL